MIGKERNPQGIVQEIKIWPRWEIHKPEFIRENGTYKILWDFEKQRNHFHSLWRLDLVKKPDLVFITFNPSED